MMDTPLGGRGGGGGRERGRAGRREGGEGEETNAQHAYNVSNTWRYTVYSDRC